MSTNIVPITLREAPWQTLASEIVIGKDILELLSSSMYVDPMTIYREYVQNAADSIDEARANGQIGPNEPGKVAINIDVPGRNVKITDNGTGISPWGFRESPDCVWGEQKAGAFGARVSRRRKTRWHRVLPGTRVPVPDAR